MHLLLITVASIFLAEVIAMILITRLDQVDYSWLVLVDATIMVAIVFPVLYYLSFRPLLANLSQREQALAELRLLQNDLEHRVEQRTLDLNQANRALSNEIAERKLAEEQLRYQATLLENVSDAIVASDEKYRLTAWNAAAEAMYGWRAEEVLGKNGVEVMRTDFLTPDPTETRRAIAEIGHWRGEATQLRKDGKRIPVEVSSIVLRHASGEIKGYVSVIRDITARKQAEAEIRLLARFPEENPNPVLRVDIDGNLLYANPASTPLLEAWNCKIGQRLPGLWCQAVLESLNAGRVREDELTCGERVYSLSLAPILDGGYVNIYGRDITDRKRAEEELRLSEERFFKAFRSSPAAISITRLADGRFLDVNDSLLKIFGYTREELIGRSSTDLYANPKERVQLMQRLLEQKTVRDYELVARAKSGESLHVLLSTEIIMLEGEPHILTILYDITERKRIEQAILLAKQEWERTFDAVPDLITIIDQEQRIVRLNRAMAERLGRTPQECIGLKCYETVHGMSCAPEYCPHVLTCHDGQTHAADIHEPRLGGNFLVSTTPIIDPHGNLVASVHVARDITEQKQAELALRQVRDELEQRVQQRTAELAQANQGLERTNAALLAEITERERVMAELRLTSAALEAAADGIFITGQQGNIRWINPAFTRMTGYTADEVIGQNPRLLSSGDQPPEFYQQMWEQILSGQVWRGQMTNRRKDGSTYFEEQTITPILSAEGQISNFIAIKQDITERVRAEQALVQTNELLKRYFSSIDTLIAYMDRDFNFIRVNEAYAKSAGRPVEYFLGKNHFDIYPHEENQAIFQRVVQTGEPYSVFEKAFEYPDHPEWGVTYWDWSLQPVKASDGSVEGLVLSLVDVTGRKRAEQELARQNEELLALSRVEHELREFAESLAQSTIALNSSLELDQVLASILEQIRRAVPFTAADIILKEGHSFRIAGFINNWDQEGQWPPPEMPSSLDDFPLLDQMFTSLQPLLLSHLDGSAEWQKAGHFEWVRSYVGAPLVASGQVFGIINLHSDQPGAFDQNSVARLTAYTAPAAAAIQNAWLFEQVRASRERLLALSRRLVEVQEGERRYIASELHDQVGQALTGLTFGLQLLEKKAEDPQAVRAELAEMSLMVENVLEELHRLAVDLRPASLDHLGLSAALRHHVAMISEKYGLEIQFEMLGIQQRLPDDIEIAFYRIVQEALNNVVRHARARRVDVILEQRGAGLVLIIEDDGVGFNPDVILARSGRLGLFGVRERAEMLGGQLIIESAEGKGTTLVVEVPYDNSHPDR